MEKIAVILSGCGVYDGAEIHESVLTYYFLDKQGYSVDFYAPNIIQKEVIDHLTKKPSSESRNVLVESARIARGDILDLKFFDIELYEAVIFPGGFGVAKNFSNYAENSTNFSVDQSIKSVIKNTHAAKKPMGFLCISPVIAASLFPDTRLTLGYTNDAQESIDILGGKGIQATAHDVVVDKDHLIASTPAYMIDASISDIAVGIEKLCKTVLSMKN